MSSQKRDLEIVLGEGGRMEGDVAAMGLGSEWRRGGEGGVWGTEQVREGWDCWCRRLGGGEGVLKELADDERGVWGCSRKRRCIWMIKDRARVMVMSVISSYSNISRGQKSF